jgi:hypothetical protein
MTVELLGLAGKAGSGKGTASKFLRDYYGYQVCPLAEPLKKALNAAFGWQMHQWEDRKWKEAVDIRYGISPRRAAQLMGTEFRELLGVHDLWLRTILYRPTLKGTKGIVVDDLRYDFEADWIRDNGGLVIHITRDNLPQVVAHSSEAGVNMKDEDFYIENITGAIPRMLNQLHDLMRANEITPITVPVGI